MEKYVKSVSRTKKFTSSDNFNADSETTYVEYFLCFSCEQRFCKREHEFAKHIFHPWINEKKIYKGNPDWLEYFLVSLTWRFARHLEIKQAKLNKNCTECTSPALQALRDYLLERSTKPGAYAPTFCYSKVEDCTVADMGSISGPTNLFFYMTLSYDQELGIEPNGGLGRSIYLQVPHFSIWHSIYGPDWQMNGDKLLEFAAIKADYWAQRQHKETTQSTRDRRTAEIDKNYTPQQLQDFYATTEGDNILRAQQYFDNL
jgi:hypothetical protein